MGRSPSAASFWNFTGTTISPHGRFPGARVVAETGSAGSSRISGIRRDPGTASYAAAASRACKHTPLLATRSVLRPNASPVGHSLGRPCDELARESTPRVRNGGPLHARRDAHRVAPVWPALQGGLARVHYENRDDRPLAREPCGRSRVRDDVIPVEMGQSVFAQPGAPVSCSPRDPRTAPCHDDAEHATGMMVGPSRTRDWIVATVTNIRRTPSRGRQARTGSNSCLGAWRYGWRARVKRNSCAADQAPGGTAPGYSSRAAQTFSVSSHPLLLASGSARRGRGHFEYEPWPRCA